MAYDIAPDTIVRRHPIRGGLWGVMLGSGIALHLLSFSVVPFGAWPLLGAPIAGAALLGIVWGRFGPVKALKGRIPASLRGARTAHDDSPQARRAAQIAAARQAQAELKSFAQANADEAMRAALAEAEADILNGPPVQPNRRIVHAAPSADANGDGDTTGEETTNDETSLPGSRAVVATEIDAMPAPTVDADSATPDMVTSDPESVATAAAAAETVSPVISTVHPVDDTLAAPSASVQHDPHLVSDIATSAPDDEIDDDVDVERTHELTAAYTPTPGDVEQVVSSAGSPLARLADHPAAQFPSDAADVDAAASALAAELDAALLAATVAVATPAATSDLD